MMRNSRGSVWVEVTETSNVVLYLGIPIVHILTNWFKKL